MNPINKTICNKQPIYISENSETTNLHQYKLIFQPNKLSTKLTLRPFKNTQTNKKNPLNRYYLHYKTHPYPQYFLTKPIELYFLCDDVRKSTVNYTANTRSQRHLRNTKKIGPNKEHRCGAGQIPSAGQVRTSHNSRVLERGKLCVPWLVRVLGLL